MKAKHLFPALLLLGIFSFFSCKDDADPLPAPGKYATGVFVVNEGPFGGAGSITWHDPTTGETVPDVFAKENNGAVLGQFVQSLSFHEGRGYIVVNGANKVYVVDAETFKFIDTIGGLALPRFFLPIDEHFAYVSQWGADGLTGSVARVDLRTLQVVATIPTGHGPEKMIRLSDGLVYVPNSGGFGLDSTISRIDAATNQEIDRLALPGKNPGSVAALAGSGTATPYALCRGSFLDPSPAGWVGHIENSTGFDIPAYGDDLVAAPGGNWLYFTAGGSIWQMAPGGSPFRWFDQTAYGLACDPATGNLYCADARDFASAGEVVIYSPAGLRLGSFPTGVAPGEVVNRH